MYTYNLNHPFYLGLKNVLHYLELPPCEHSLLALLKVFVCFTACSDDERDDTSSTESIVGILEWTRGAITAVPRYIWSKDLINSLDLSNVFPPT